MKSILDGRELKRGIAVKLVKQGWRYRAIAEILNVSNSFISKWESRFKSAGVMGLKLSYKGAKSYLTAAEMSEVIIRKSRPRRTRAVSFLNFDKATKHNGRGFVALNPHKIKSGINNYEKSSSSPAPLPPAPLLPNFSTENETALHPERGKN